MKRSAKILSFIVLLGFLQFFIFKVGEIGGFLHISAIAVHFQVHCSQMEMLSLLFTDAAKIYSDSVRMFLYTCPDILYIT